MTKQDTQTLTQHSPTSITTRPYVIAICGASGSGKSLFTHNLVQRFQTHALRTKVDCAQEPDFAKSKLMCDVDCRREPQSSLKPNNNLPYEQ